MTEENEKIVIEIVKINVEMLNTLKINNFKEDEKEFKRLTIETKKTLLRLLEGYFIKKEFENIENGIQLRIFNLTDGIFKEYLSKE